MTVRGVVFDLDGTLVDSRQDIVAACQHMLHEHGRPELPPDEIAGFVGDGARLLVARATRLRADEPALEPFLATYLAYYAAHGHERTGLLPGVESVLDALQHLPLALCTYKPRATLDPLLEHLDLVSRFTVVVGAEDVPRHKPDPLPLQYIAERLATSASHLVMVGDGPQDVEAGRAAGARTVGIPGCFLPRSRLVAACPDVLIEDITELPGTIARWDPHAIV